MVAEQSSRFIIANITWNKTAWRSIYVDPRAGHYYARRHPGQECLNFKFDKKGLDTEKNIFGFVQWNGPPRKLVKKKAAIFFFTRNLESRQNEIVGIYGNVKILEPGITTRWKGFQYGKLISNIKADKEFSLLFSYPLDADKYKIALKRQRLVPRGGFTYINSGTAARIIHDEIELVRKSGVRKGEDQKLVKIYEFITGKKYDVQSDYVASKQDEEEQEELESLDEVRQQSKEDIIKELASLGPQIPEEVEVKGRTYKRDNKTIVQLKKLRDYKCQICGHKIQKKNGGYYVEAAHIKRKSMKGAERANNILILCPNHHKEFDFGKRNVIEHDDNRIVFDLNGKKYKVNLSLSA